jgi:hypothetical protein
VSAIDESTARCILSGVSVVVVSSARRKRRRFTEATMKTIMVRYKTLDADAGANETLVRAVFDELRSRAPAGLRYAAYRLPDGVTFVHMATLESRDENPLTRLPSFKAFQSQLAARCVEPPVVTELSAIDSYGFVRDESTTPGLMR